MEPQSPAPHKIKNLFRQILNHYKEKDQASSQPPNYYVHTEFDSNVTLFEGLSKENRIVLLSSLDYIDLFVVFSIFQQIYDDNYIFDECVIDQYIADIDCEDEELAFDGASLATFENPAEWIQFLTAYYQDNLEPTEEMDAIDEMKQEHDREQVGNIEKYTTKPHIVDCGFKPKTDDGKRIKKPAQKIYKIKNIIEMLD